MGLSGCLTHQQPELPSPRLFGRRCRRFFNRFTITGFDRTVFQPGRYFFQLSFDLSRNLILKIVEGSQTGLAEVVAAGELS